MGSLLCLPRAPSAAVTADALATITAADTHAASIAVDSWGTIRFVNAACCALLQYSPAELLDNDVDFVLPPRLRGSSGASWGATVGKQGRIFVVTLPLSLLRKDGMEIACSVEVRPVEHPQVLLISISEAGSRARIAALESELRSAEIAVHERGAFLSRMSHELRSPLNGIVASADLLASGQLDYDQRDAVHTILACCDMTLSVVNDILDFSKIDAGMMHLTNAPFDLSALLSEVVGVFKPVLNAKRVLLQTTADSALESLVSGDRARVRQIMLNIIGNAVKFTDRGCVIVHTSSTELPCDPGVAGSNTSVVRLSISVRVTDTGIGMTSDTISRLFQPFVQADSSTTRLHGGSGLGLVIAKKLVEMMSGEIDVSSEPGIGSVFTVSVILHRARAATPQQLPADTSFSSTSSSPAATPPTPVCIPLPAVVLGRASAGAQPSLLTGNVLVADDSLVNVSVMSKILQRFGLACDSVSTGHDAVRAVASSGGAPYDLIFMDIEMPLMDGLEATRQIRAMEAASGTRVVLPIVAVTASALYDDRTRCLRAGMTSVLTKPIRLRVVEEVVRRYLRPVRRQPVQSAGEQEERRGERSPSAVTTPVDESPRIT